MTIFFSRKLEGKKITKKYREKEKEEAKKKKKELKIDIIFI